MLTPTLERRWGYSVTIDGIVTYQVVHETRYAYSQPVLGSHQLAHLTPRQSAWQQVRSHRIVVEPEPSDRSSGTDYFCNEVLHFALDLPHATLTVRAESLVEVQSQIPGQNAATIQWEQATCSPARGTADFDPGLEYFRIQSPMVPFLEEVTDYARPSFLPGRPWLEAITELTHRIRSDFIYDPKATTVTTGIDEVIMNRRGVCQDFAHLMISCLRSLGIPARYVSGYVLNTASLDAPPLVGADASHAWIAAHCPGLGWVAFDPTNGKLADLEFVTLGWGREFSDVTPLRGVVLGSATQSLSVAVRMERFSDNTRQAFLANSSKSLEDSARLNKKPW